MIRFVRPSRLEDLPGIIDLLRASGDQLTTLPLDPEFIEQRLHESIRAFYPRIKSPGGEYYFFVLVEEPGGHILGTSAIVARVGGFDPFYSYEIRTESFAYEPAGLAQEISVLHLRRSHKGPAEICSLFLHPDLRSGGWGRLLSLSRFVFMAGFRERFDPQVIAEIRGWLDANGTSPFWEAVGHHFFQKDFLAADMISGMGNKEFIEALMPKHPVYVPILPKEAQEVIGRPHERAEPAYRLLLKEGFRTTREVDIFDAGPSLRASLQNIRTVRKCRHFILRGLVPVSELAPTDPGHRPGLLANRRLDFRCCQGDPLQPHGQLADLPEDLAHALGLEIGEEFLAVAND